MRAHSDASLVKTLNQIAKAELSCENARDANRSSIRSFRQDMKL